jgi:hypothetical protein
MFDMSKYPCKLLTQEEWAKNIDSRKSNLSKSLRESLCEIFEKYSHNHDLSEARLLSCSFLRTSVLEKSPLYLLSLFGEKKLLDLHPEEKEWGISCVSSFIYSNIPMPNGQLKGFYDPNDYEVEQLWMEEAEKLDQAMAKAYGGILAEALSGIDFGARKIEYTFGKYLDKQELINIQKEG